MSRAGCGLSECEDATEAVLRAVDDAMLEGRLSAPSAAFLFATYPHSERLGELAGAVREISGAATVVGASGTGVLTSRGEVEGRPAVAVLLVESDTIEFRALGAENLRGRGELVAAELGAQMRREAGGSSEGRARLLVLFPDPAVFDPLSFFTRLERSVGILPTVGGGVTSLLGQAAATHDQRQVSRGVAGMLLEGRFTTRIATLGSFRLVSRLMRITRCQGNLVSELDGLPALGVFQSLGARLLGLDPVRAAQALFVALAAGTAPERDEPALLVRTLVGLDPARQVLALSQPVEVGQELAFCVLEPQEARRRLREGLRGMQGPPPSFALYFNCAGRGQSFYGEPDVDTRQIRESLGPIPMAGFFSGAELAPAGGRNVLHLYSGVLTLIHAA